MIRFRLLALGSLYGPTLLYLRGQGGKLVTGGSLSSWRGFRGEGKIYRIRKILSGS